VYVQQSFPEFYPCGGEKIEAAKIVVMRMYNVVFASLQNGSQVPKKSYLITNSYGRINDFAPCIPHLLIQSSFAAQNTEKSPLPIWPALPAFNKNIYEQVFNRAFIQILDYMNNLQTTFFSFANSALASCSPLKTAF
jgi:hypothetical protein